MRAARLLRLEVPELLLARHGLGGLFYPMSLLKMHFFSHPFPPSSIYSSQVIQFPPNAVLDKNPQRVTSDYNSWSVGCSLPGYLIY